VEEVLVDVLAVELEEVELVVIELLLVLQLPHKIIPLLLVQEVHQEQTVVLVHLELIRYLVP
jgi:hypothetical protein